MSGALHTWKMLKSSSNWVYFKGLIIGEGFVLGELLWAGGWEPLIWGTEAMDLGLHSCKSAK